MSGHKSEITLDQVRAAIGVLEEQLRISKNEIAQIMVGVYAIPMAAEKQANYDSLLREQQAIRQELANLLAREKTLTASPVQNTADKSSGLMLDKHTKDLRARQVSLGLTEAAFNQYIKPLSKDEQNALFKELSEVNAALESKTAEYDRLEMELHKANNLPVQDSVTGKGVIVDPLLRADFLSKRKQQKELNDSVKKLSGLKLALETGYVPKKSYSPALISVGTPAEELFRLQKTIGVCETDFLAARQRLTQFRGKEGAEWSKLPQDAQKAYVDIMLVQSTLLRRLQVFYRSEGERKRIVPLVDQKVVGDSVCRVRVQQLKRPQSMVSARSFQLYLEKLSHAAKQHDKVAFQSLQEQIHRALWLFDNLLEELASLEDTFLLSVTQAQQLSFNNQISALIEQRVRLLFLYRTESEYVSESRTGPFTTVYTKEFLEVPVAFNFVPSLRPHSPPQVTPPSTGNILLPAEGFDAEQAFKKMLADCVTEILTQHGSFSSERSLRVIKELEGHIPFYLIRLGLLAPGSEGKKPDTTHQVYQGLSSPDLDKAQKIAQKYVHAFTSQALQINGRGFYRPSFFKHRARHEKTVACLFCQVVFFFVYGPHR
jgi:hypothetical protein